MGARDVLVSARHRDGIAAVVRERDGLWVIGDLEGGGGTGLDGYQPAVAGLAGGRTVQGGELPAGAVAAEVVDDAGVRRPAVAANGAWVVVLEQPTDGRVCPVRFTDAAARTIARPLPPGWPRSPVDDAPEPCPACRASGWDEVRPLDGSRDVHMVHGGAWEPTRLVVCRSCGHEEPAGAVIFASLDADGGDVPAGGEMAAWAADARAALRHVDFPVYAARGRSPRLGGWSGHGGRTDSVTIVHLDDAAGDGPALSVETERDEHPFGEDAWHAREALEQQLHENAAEVPQRSPAGLAVWFAAQERKHRRAAATAVVAEREIAMDEARARFHVAGAGSNWAAVRHHDNLRITVRGRGIPPDQVTLARLPEPIAAQLELPSS